MFLIDDILLAPLTGILWVLKELNAAVQQELGSEQDRLISDLTSLYMKLETGKITEAEFQEEEAVLLDRLDQLQKRDSSP